MIGNIIIWTVSSVILSVFGFSFLKFLGINLDKINWSIVLVTGTIPTIALSSLCGLFYRINYELLIVVILLSIAQFYFIRSYYFRWLKDVLSKLYELNNLVKLTLFIFILVTALQAALPTNIPDTGYYYLQTIKWLNQIGIPHNITLFGYQYSQFSSWHIMQSLFNFSFFFGNKFNNQNGLFLCLFAIYLLIEFNNTTNARRTYLLFCMFLLLPLQFYNTGPSPDLPVIIISLMLFDSSFFNKNSEDNIRISILLIVLAIIIKPSSFYLLLFIPLILRNVSLKLLDRKIIFVVSCIAILTIAKNYRSSGLPLYPTKFAESSMNTTEPYLQIINDGHQVLLNSAFTNEYQDVYKEFTFKEQVSNWLHFPGYKQYVNLYWILSSILVLIIGLIKRHSFYVIIFAISILYLGIIWSIGPHYRFALGLIFMCTYLLLKVIPVKINLGKNSVLVPIVISLSLIWVTPISRYLKRISSNPIVRAYYPITTSRLLYPSQPFVSKRYEEVYFNGTKIYIPPDYHYAWDGPIPCVMRNHYEKYILKE